MYPTHYFRFSAVGYLYPPPRALTCRSYIMCIMIVHTFTKDGLLRHGEEVSIKKKFLFQLGLVIKYGFLPSTFEVFVLKYVKINL